MALDLSSMGLGGGGGGKATASSNSSSSATNALNLAFNPNVTSTVGGQLWPYSSGDSYGNPSSSATGTATANPADSNPSMNIPWYYPGGGGAYDIGSYPRTTTGTTGYVGTSGSSQSSMVLFAMIGIALIFLMKK